MKNPEPEIAAAAVKGRRIAERLELEKARLDLARYRATDRAAAQRARNAKTARIEAGIELAYDAIKARLEAVSLPFRAKKLRKHIANKLKETPGTYGLRRPPGRDTLDRVCRRLAK